ncbi:cyclic nucleotide-binding domain-containing protein [Roseomonas sp. CCTCC AB2023176]|uniref:cyclic nucleotide-binding domain-containing protein n=1 Tax=Roseomonas sp. CCTCC AB2023176 TaxID=3342640 RepID=UPI0035DF6D31
MSDTILPGIEAAARYVAAGEAVVRAGEPGGEMYVVIAGSVEVLDAEGQPATRIGPGGTFGEVALVDGGPRLRTVRAGPEGRGCCRWTKRASSTSSASSRPSRSP